MRLYQALQRLPDMLASLKAYAGCHTSLLGEVVATPLFELNQDFSKFLQLVESTVDLDLIQQHQFLLKPSMDESLQRKPHSHSSHPHTSRSLIHATKLEFIMASGDFSLAVFEQPDGQPLWLSSAAVCMLYTVQFVM